MSNELPEYWTVDLSKLTVIGWLLFLASFALLIAIGFAVFGVMFFCFGLFREPENDPWFADYLFEGLVAGIGLPLSGWFFVAGRSWLSSARYPITHQ